MIISGREHLVPKITGFRHEVGTGISTSDPGRQTGKDDDGAHKPESTAYGVVAVEYCRGVSEPSYCFVTYTQLSNRALSPVGIS